MDSVELLHPHFLRAYAQARTVLDSLTFDRVADIYDATRALPRDVMDAVLSCMKEAFAGCTMIIDVGVGTGRFAAPLQSLGFEVAGVDISRGMMNKAREKGVRNLLMTDARRMPFRDGAFDAATVVHVLHLVQPWQAVAGEIGRVARKRVVSMIEHEEGGGPKISSEYSRIRAELGYPQGRSEEAEGPLLERIHPSAVLDAATYSEEEDADEEITYLQRHSSSRTWGLDEGVHTKIISTLRAKYSGKKWTMQHSIGVAVWDPDQFRAQTQP